MHLKDFPRFNIFSSFVIARSPQKSSIIHPCSVEDDMLYRRAVEQIPHFLASATNTLFSSLSHRKPGIRTDSAPVLAFQLNLF